MMLLAHVLSGDQSGMFLNLSAESKCGSAVLSRLHHRLQQVQPTLGALLQDLSVRAHRVVRGAFKLQLYYRYLSGGGAGHNHILKSDTHFAKCMSL